MHSLSGMYEQLVQVLPLQGVARLVRLSLSWLAPRPHLDLAQARLRCIQRTAKGPVFAGAGQYTRMATIRAGLCSLRAALAVRAARRRVSPPVLLSMGRLNKDYTQKTPLTLLNKDYTQNTPFTPAA